MHIEACSLERVSVKPIQNSIHNTFPAYIVLMITAVLLTALMTGCATITYVPAPSNATDATVCGKCAGKTTVTQKCPFCGGKGVTLRVVPSGSTYYQTVMEPCPSHSETRDVQCDRCSGTGKVYCYDKSGKRL